MSTREARSHQEELRQSEERFRLLVEEVKDYAILMLDPEGYVTTWNKGARCTIGYEGEEMIGEHVSLFYTEEDIERNHSQQELRVAAAEDRYGCAWRARALDLRWRLRIEHPFRKAIAHSFFPPIAVVVCAGATRNQGIKRISARFLPPPTSGDRIRLTLS